MDSDEAAAFENFLKLELRASKQQIILALKFLRESRNSTELFETELMNCVQIFRGDRRILEHLLDAIFAIGYSDGLLSVREQRVAEIAARVFDISQLRVDEIRARRLQISQIEKRLRALLNSTPEEEPRIDRQAEFRDPVAASFSEEAAHYAILGCKPEATWESIRVRYRKLAFECHPDRLMSKGVSPEFLKLSEERFKAIQAAYDYISERKGRR
mgnify:CR=1 FL=1